ncbi:arf-GAP with Rho-GAP domain, ANK repeat and PH domain-containing protein 1-like isoform X1 [Conger conger]|uniref:arf-GAP with Rho-GAP domain, ANK repeat and PH domain-containing protein 1-like isoform X1 n=1 Tax=Conger conger TaxID=82655 RepID=UPI002A5AC70C|nr:arf-GAP with Rho-GAP domain, ANK repeat and PH domain-containing protein 1-like isoform X1 [Conger conger]
MSSGAELISVCEWLTVLRLEQYSPALQGAGFATLSECRRLTPADLQQAGVVLPGHQKRILASLQKTFSEEPAPDRPVPRERAGGLPSSCSDSFKVDGGPGPTQSGGPEPCPAGTQDKPPPPIPPRASLNCPPVKFTPVPVPRPRPETLSVRPQEQQQQGGRKPTPTSLTPSTSSSSSSSSSSEPVPLNEQSPVRMGVPVLPPKCHPGGAPKEPRGPPPLPRRPPIPAPRVLPSETAPQPSVAPVREPPVRESPVRESPVRESPVRESPVHESPDRVPDLPPRSTPASQPSAAPRQSKRIIHRPPPEFRSGSTNSSEGYEEPEPFFSPVFEPVDMADKDGFLHVPRGVQKRFNSVCSDDELLDDDGDAAYEPIPVNRGSWMDGGIIKGQDSVYLPLVGRVPSQGHIAQDDLTPQHTPVIKMGWLDKNPPQGSLIYQKRWVKLDADYLRYFDSEKDVYSKRFIPTSSITSITNIGDQKFEVVTHNRTFLFRAESDADRNEWVSVLQEATGERRMASDPSAHPGAAEMQGYLELRGLRPKLFVVVSRDKVYLYKNTEDYRLGIGITSIDMNVGNVKDADKRGFDLTTPYRIFSFIAESDQQKEEWVEAMRNSIGEALSNYEVAKKIWSEESNEFCADCGTAQPEWAAINLCVVFCKRCAGQHRGLGPSISKVRSLKMDRKVWTEELIQVFQLLGNEQANHFWAANVPPSEALSPSSCSEDRQRFITAKYREGKYRRYHQLFGNQQELDSALCINIQTNDVLETLSLVFCGANVNCHTGNPEFPSPIALAQSYNQQLQVEFLSQNRNTEIPRSEVGGHMDTVPYMAPPSITNNGFLFKTASMGRPITERKGKEEFSRRWCTLNDGNFNYYESDKNSTPNGGLKMKEIVCLAVNPPEKHGYDHTFEIYTDSERLYLFGTDNPDTMREWVKSITKSFIPANAEDLLNRDFERVGRLRYKDGLNLQSPRVGWFALVGSTLHACFEDSEAEEAIHLRKLHELSKHIQQENEVLVLVERGRTLYIEGERKLDFLGWSAAIERAAGSSGDTLSQQQLTESDVPVIVDRCIDYITQCGLTSEGIYRKSGVNSKIAALLENFRQDARSMRLREGEHQVDDVSNVLKRFFRDVEEGIFTSQATPLWLKTTALGEESKKIAQYQFLFSSLPRVNKSTLRTLVNHLYCVQRFADMNQMNLHNLAIVFGPTLFQTDGKDYNAGRVIEELIEHYVAIFNVNEQQLKTQLDEITFIIRVRENQNPKVPSTSSGDFICTVYLEEKRETAEQHVKIPATMTAAELAFEILDRRKISFREKDYWCCFEVNEKEETERPLHYQEKVLPILHSLGTDSYLVVRKHFSMEAMLVYLASKVDVSKHGMMKFREGRNLLGLGLNTGSFHDRYFILTSTSLRLYKEVRSLQKLQTPELLCSNRPEKEWPVKCLRVYQGIKKRLRPPTCWGLTVIYENEKPEKHERQQWYLCCDTQSEMREWFATFLSIQHEGSVWPAETIKMRTSRTVALDARLGNVSLIPLRGSENEMRNSVAAFTADPLALFRDV